MRRLTAAEQLLQSLGVTEPSEIDLEAIAYDRGAVVTYRPLKGCEARIVGAGDRAVITVDTHGGTPARRRFSTAHELGHWHHHRGKCSICRADDIGNYRRNPLDPERVADAYAADLLLPIYLFAPRADKLKTATFEAVDKLREEFQTSITATALRLVEFGPEPAMLVCHGKAGRKWFRRPAHIPERWFPKDELDSESYAFEVLHGGVGRSRRAVIGADAWFDRFGADQFEVYEQTHKIGDDDVLTIIVFKDDRMIED